MLIICETCIASLARYSPALISSLELSILTVSGVEMCFATSTRRMLIIMLGPVRRYKPPSAQIRAPLLLILPSPSFTFLFRKSFVYNAARLCTPSYSLRCSAHGYVQQPRDPGLPKTLFCQGAYRRRNAHVARLTILDCDTPCSALSSATSASDGSLTSVCTSTMVNNLAQCYDCEVKVAAITQEKGQANLDRAFHRYCTHSELTCVCAEFIAGCKAGGLPVDSVTISAANSNIGEADSSGGPSSSSDSSVPAGSGDAPATSPGPAPPTSPTTFATSPANSKTSPAPSKAPASGAPPTPSGASTSSPPPQTGGAVKTSTGHGLLGVATALVFLVFGMFI
ncbi:hypothetical protein B0H13DRAFT_158919 [Mycena leptocephala]|nr:hypothetical protein B0H13DRAFT_158919 [Mycena leptocephala]